MSPRAREIYLQRIQQPIDQLQVPYADRINDQLYSINYKTKPVDVVTFVQDQYYLGETLRGNLYPILLDDLQELFAGDYVEVLLKGGIGYGKTTFSYIAIAYDIYLVSCLKEPAAAFGLIPGTSLAFVNVSITEKMAKRILFKGIVNLIKQSPYFRENFPYDPNLTNEIRFPRGVICYPVATTEQSLLGEGVFSAAFDEMNFYAVVERSKLDAGRWRLRPSADAVQPTEPPPQVAHEPARKDARASVHDFLVALSERLHRAQGKGSAGRRQVDIWSGTTRSGKPSQRDIHERDRSRWKSATSRDGREY